jgi:hypothetical protein
MEAGSQNRPVQEYLEIKTAENTQNGKSEPILNQEKIDSRIFYRLMGLE